MDLSLADAFLLRRAMKGQGERLKQIARLDRLAHESVKAADAQDLAFALDACRERYDWNASIASPFPANGRCSLSAAHSGHLQIHENRVEGQGAGLLDRLAPVRSLCDLKA